MGGCRGEHQGEPLEMEAEAAEADDVSEEQTEVSVHQYCILTIDGDHVHLVFEHLPSHHLQNHTSPAVLASHTVAFHRSIATVLSVVKDSTKVI